MMALDMGQLLNFFFYELFLSCIIEKKTEMDMNSSLGDEDNL